MKCLFDDKEVNCKVTENMGFQGGRQTKSVMYDGKERIVQKYGEVWKPREIRDKF